ncbi:MAG: signal recognition particle-docking protein FtsY [Legionellales bacterium]|jgi:fused signal recognition particle receptor|nr:signal recognition particle-docking protein FtsY [Legionellales bacterium]|tara:strand:- start:153 stop:1046 length:894 start_codon:yes stop_codon:yes gene_type:complete
MITLANTLKATRDRIFGTLFKTNSQVDNSIINELEDRLLLADTGVKTTDLIIEALTAELKTQTDCTSPKEKLKKVLMPLFESIEGSSIISEGNDKPHLILVVGANGVGKTTTIGKLTKYFQSMQKSVVLAAGDTFRAAAFDQLKIWGERNKVKVISHGTGSDPGAVVYDAIESACTQNTDILIADTAGRLHNKKNLMEEIKKINKISNKFKDKISKETMLVLDASTGQNAITQAKEFNEAIGIDGIVLTKLDGTAKGGIVFSLVNELKIPIRFLGMGEQIDDLCPFNAIDFIEAVCM